MKKILAVVLVLILCFGFIGCKNESKEKEPNSVAGDELNNKKEDGKDDGTTQKPTKEPAKNSSKKKAEELKNKIKQAAGEEPKAEITVEDGGYFVYKNIRDAKDIYSQERSVEGEKAAYNTALNLAKELEAYYGKLEGPVEDFIDIGGGDNGIDSVLYNFYFVNKGRGEIRIQIDSDGVISYIESGCAFK